ncbi:transporter [Nodosilinea sp. P-1105]|uniref:transporter n=1 Tax=Nodosilinea sp. P-1105 TaxID=2546229 RepID=UPI00146DF7CA|nr:transporter [Nodosilinea sp. P-1105]NMF82847.1 transporter [Nodosilinea sp. P-1105]
MGLDISQKVRSIFAGVVCLATALVSSEPVQAQAYGPRQFLPAPTDTNAALFQIKNFQTNTSFDISEPLPELDIDVNTTAFVFTYIRNFSIADTSTQIVLTQPVVTVDAGASAGELRASRQNTGLADAQAELRIGILGAPVVDIPEYVQYYFSEENPNVVMKGLLNVTLPTGNYRTDQVINIGSNRFAFRAGLPTTINLGPNWAPGNRTLLEIIPSVDVFTNNNSPSFSSFNFRPNVTSQAPIFRLESQLSTDLGEKYFAALGAYYIGGGATSSDGVDNNNAQSWLGVGGTLGGALWEGGLLTVGYGGVVLRNDNSPRGTLFNLYLRQSF